MEDRRPYLDKIHHTASLPPCDGYSDLNSRTTFPNLKHTGLRSIFEPETTIVATPEGRITTDFKQEAYQTLKDIFHDDIELKSREIVFKINHKQFMDDVLNDMESKRQASMTKRRKYWTANKSELGFDEKFESFQQVGGEIAPSTAEGATRSRTAASFAMKEERKQKAVNRMLLFKSLLETVDPPKSPHNRFGTMERLRSQQQQKTYPNHSHINMTTNSSNPNTASNHPSR